MLSIKSFWFYCCIQNSCFKLKINYFYYFRSLEGLSDTEHKEFTERLTENTRQFLLSQLRAKIVDSSIDSSTSSDNDS